MKCWNCKAEISWSELHGLCLSVLLDSMHKAYYSAIQEIRNLIWLAQRIKKADEFRDEYKEILLLLDKIRSFADDAMDQLRAQEKTEEAVQVVGEKEGK